MNNIFQWSFTCVFVLVFFFGLEIHCSCVKVLVYDLARPEFQSDEGIVSLPPPLFFLLMLSLELWVVV